MKFISWNHKTAHDIHKYTSMLCIELSLTPKVFHLSDYEAYKENLTIRNLNDKVSRNFY